MNSNVENSNKKAGEKRKRQRSQWNCTKMYTSEGRALLNEVHLFERLQSIISTTSAERRSSITGLSDDSFYIENSTPGKRFMST